MKARTGVLVALLLLAWRPAAAADQVRIGKLDGERVFKEYKLYQKLNDELQSMGRKLLSEFDERKRKYPLLLDDEWNTLLTLRQKGANMTPTEKQQYDKLIKQSDERDRELAELEGQAKLDDKQQARWRELVAIRTQASQMLQDQWDRIQKQGADRTREMESQLNAEIRAAVKKVAEANGLTVVLQAEVLIFGGEDITETVLQTLNAAVATGPAAPAGGAATPPAGQP